MLEEEIEVAQRQVRTDAYQMSIGELVGMYDEGEIVIAPEFQRLFRWDIGQKSKLIESLLLGIPLPSIFVYELKNGNWELVDGLQRISTVLEFMGKLRDPDGNLTPPSILESTKYLPSLGNTIWQESEELGDEDLAALSKSQQLAIKRSRISVEILKRPSDSLTKFDLFQRLNSGGTLANAQELRNCIILMVNAAYFREIRNSAEKENFKTLTRVSESQAEKQRHIEWACRLLVQTLIPYDRSLDVGEYVDEGIITLAEIGKLKEPSRLIDGTFDLLKSASGDDALRRISPDGHSGRVSLVGLDCIATGVAKNLKAIKKLPEPEKFVIEKIEKFWLQPEIETFVTPGLRGTIRIQRTIPFGDQWFKP